MYDYATRTEQINIEEAIAEVSTQVDTLGDTISYCCTAILFVLVLNIVIKFVRSLL